MTKNKYKKRAKISEETREKHRQLMLGDKNPSKRPEVREKIRLHNLGKKANPESISKMREAQRNRWEKELGESKRKTREELAGDPRPNNCEICGNSGKICFDHNHETGAFRGWICSHCNLVLGLMKDNANTFESMAEYLRRNSGQ